MKRPRVLLALALLYVTQGIPFGLAAEYLPVALRKSGFGLAQIAALGWLQLPWQAKVLWASVADRDGARRRPRVILLVLQVALAATIAAYAAFELGRAPVAWFVITALAAFFAATQDIFVDALAVRVLGPDDRGFGNVAQVAGYRLGMIIGGAGLLVVVGSLGTPTTILACAAIVLSASLAAFSLRGEEPASVTANDRTPDPLTLRALLAHQVSRGAAPVLVLAGTFKLGVHMASVLIKPMCVDAHWTDREIGVAAVTLGTACGLVGAACGGLLHRRLGEPRALAVAAVAQAGACLPLVFAALAHTPRGLTTVAIAVEHFASGVGTTVLFAALMSATRPANAGLHYTLLTSLNAVAIGVGGIVSGKIGDRLGFAPAYAIAALVCLAPVLLVPRWRAAAAASSS